MLYYCVVYTVDIAAVAVAFIDYHFVKTRYSYDVLHRFIGKYQYN